ncbi:Bug family tripartite tricarboxylate transporter substrate binding protein [Cupriavidus basilensis]
MTDRRNVMKAACALLLAGGVWWQDALCAPLYPAKSITLVLPVAAGNGADIVARLLAQQIGMQIGQAVVVENRPGAGSVAAIKYAANASPDGYTLILIGSANALSQSLYKSPPYDVLRDLVPVSDIARTDIAILTGKRSKFNSVKDFIRAAREQPGRLTAGISLLGTTGHLMAELFKAREKLDFSIVPFKTSSNLHASLMNGDVDVAFDLAPPALAQLRAGGLRALAIGSGTRSVILPDVPTLKELGFENYEIVSTMQIAAPAHTPTPIVERLNREIQRALSQPELQKRFRDQGFATEGGTATQAREHVAGEVEKWRNVIRATQIELQ